MKEIKLQEILEGLDFASGMFDFTLEPDQCTILLNHIRTLENKLENAQNEIECLKDEKEFWRDECESKNSEIEYLESL